MNSKILLLIIILGLSNYGYAGEKRIYAWKDQNGVLVFSDTPRKGATEVKLSSQSLTIPAKDIATLSSQSHTKKTGFGIAITSPEHNQTIHENTGTIYVTSRVMPSFKAGYTIQLLVNGEANGPAINNSVFAIADVEAGEHMLQVRLFNEKNQIIAVSEPRIFNMRRKGKIHSN